MVNTQAGYAPRPSQLGSEPDCRIGRRSIHVTIDFSLGSKYQLDLSQVQAQGQFDSVQTIYIDNSENLGALNLLCGVTLQEIIIPAGAQAYMPVLQPNPPVMQFTALTGTPLVDIQLLNFFVPPVVWYTAGLPVTDLTLAAVISNGGVNVNATPLVVTNPSDASGTITLGGTRQSLFAANAARKRWILSNPSNATEILQFSYKLNTAGLIDLPPGTTWSESDFSVSGDQIWVVAATTAHAFTAYQW